MSSEAASSKHRSKNVEGGSLISSEGSSLYGADEENDHGDLDSCSFESSKVSFEGPRKGYFARSSSSSVRREMGKRHEDKRRKSTTKHSWGRDFLCDVGDDESQTIITIVSSDDSEDDFSDLVKVAVEATAVFDLDPVEDSTNICLSVLERKRPVFGTNFVGTVLQDNEEANQLGMKTGSRVAAVVSGGATSRFIWIPAFRLVAVPKHLEAGDVVSVLSSYLPAFAALHHGRVRPYRYSGKCLNGRSVLIHGCTSLEAQAAVRMAEMAGASHIYVTAPPEYNTVLQKCRPTILNEEGEEWLGHVEGRMDVVLNYKYPRDIRTVAKALTSNGRLICSSGQRATSNSCFSLENLTEYCYLASMKGATLFSFADYIEDIDEMQIDLEFFWKLLSTRELRPDIDRFVSLKELNYVDLTRRPLFGAIICDPWTQR